MEAGSICDGQAPLESVANETISPVMTPVDPEIGTVHSLLERIEQYMANFSPGRNFSPANRAEISSRLLKQILLKSNCRLHGEGFSPGRNSARAKNPSFSNRARIFRA